MKDKKNIIYIISGIIAIFGLYFGYSYFKGAGEGEIVSTNGKTNGDSIFQNNENGSSGAPAAGLPESENPSPIVLDGSDNGIYNLISLMERLALDTDFFEDEKFKELRDFTKEVAVLEEEKGNINPFRPVSALFVPSGVRSASSTEEN